MELSALVDVWEAVRATRSRKAKIGHLAGFLKELEPEEIDVGVAFVSGEPRQSRLGAGYRTVSAVEAEPATWPSLAILDVDACFLALEAISGPGSQQARKYALAQLFSRATEREQTFLRQLMLRSLRQGALEGLVVEALATAAGVPTPPVRRAVMLGGGLQQVGAALLRSGLDGLARFTLTLFHPLQPMLAQTASSVAAALGQLGRAQIERKLDGARIQVHRRGDELKVYTRNLRDITASVPEITTLVGQLDVSSIILDGESLAVDAVGRPHAFQETMGRFAQNESGFLTAVFFDCLHVDGRDLLDESTSTRFDALVTHLPAERVIPRIVTDDVAVGDAFFAETLAAGHEGVVVKSLDAAYEAGRRGAAWLKVKPVHTLDLVVIGVEWGSGRRQGWLSNLHLGARDPATGEFVMLGKTFKGLTDEMLAWQTERFLALETHRDGHVVYVRPEQVVEIAFDAVQTSRRYPGGVALRFARVKRYRDDKRAEQADTIDAIRAIHRGAIAPAIPT